MIKVKNKIGLLAVILVIVFNANLVFASEKINVLIDDKQQYFSPVPIIQNGFALVPMRSFFEALGADIQWDGLTRTVLGKRDNVTVQLKINQRSALVNGANVKLSLPGKIINGNTYVPLRFVGEALGDDVKWNSMTNTISIKVHRTPNYLALGNKFFYATDFDSALEMYKKANKLNPDDPVPYFKIGITIENNGSKDDAIYYFDKAIELDQYCAYGYLYKGYFLYEHGDEDGAQKCYDMYEQIKSKYPKESERCAP